MVPSQTGSHASSKTPSAYIPREERIDLAVPMHAIRAEPTYTCAHLNHLECRGESVFADARCVNWFLNALRLHWKVSGRVLRSLSDQAKDLWQFLTLEVEGRRIISDLFTDDAVYYLLGRSDHESIMILTAIIQDIYNTQWQSWSEEQNNKHKQQGHHALVIFHAQATANQLSNNILAFKDNAAPELRRWAETTVSGHLMAIVTPGHLPHRPAVRETTRFAFEDSAPTRDMMSVKDANASFPGSNVTPDPLPPRPTTCNVAPCAFNKDLLNRDLMDVRHTDISSPRTAYIRDNHSRRQGSPVGRYQAPICTGHSYSGGKRKISLSTPYHYYSPSYKRFKVKPENTSNYRSYNTYRPSPIKRRTFECSDNRSARADTRRDNRIYPTIPERSTTARGTPAIETPAIETPAIETPAIETPAIETPAIGTPTREKIRRAKLDLLPNEIAQQKPSTMSSFVARAFDSSSGDSDDRKVPVTDGPSYHEFIRNQEDEAGKLVIPDKDGTAGHARTKSYGCTDEGEVLE
ncbi:hypothetical protein E4T42_09609 [Aureobasidium subglaciale]|nr:hypothetical protein E4T42_09609 [Aureobasidium subglaciale]